MGLVHPGNLTESGNPAALHIRATMRVRAAALHCPWINLVHQCFKELKKNNLEAFTDRSVGNNLTPETSGMEGSQLNKS